MRCRAICADFIGCALYKISWILAYLAALSLFGVMTMFCCVFGQMVSAALSSLVILAAESMAAATVGVPVLTMSSPPRSGSDDYLTLFQRHGWHACCLDDRSIEALTFLLNFDFRLA